MTTLIEALQTLQDNGVRTIDVYFAVVINEGDIAWSMDVMCDPVNDMAKLPWTWTIYSLDEVKQIIGEDRAFVCDYWDIIVDVPFSDQVVCPAIDNWLRVNNIKLKTRLIDINDAVGSGYIKEMREMYLDELRETCLVGMSVTSLSDLLQDD